MGLFDLTIALLSVSVFALARTRLPKQVLMPDGIFLGVLMFFVGSLDGAFKLHYIAGAEEVLHLSTICLASTAFGSLLLPLAYRDLPSMVAPPRTPNELLIKALAFGLVLFNLGFSYLVFVKLLGGSWSALSSETGLLGIRKMISTGEKGYFFPGLVKQVRDVLAPAFLFYLLAYTRPGAFRKVTILVGASTLFAIFLGGQRAPLLVMAWVLFAGRRTGSLLRGVQSGKRMSFSKGFGYMLVAVPGLAAINALLGRSEIGTGIFEIAWNTVYGVYDRLVLIVPLASIESFQFVMVRDVGFGELWLADLAILLPGTQSGFSNQLHSFLGGSLAGNAVLGMPVNAYFNAGIIGVVVFPIVAMFSAAALDRIVAKMRDPLLTSARCVLVAFMPICYDPYLFLLSGGLFFLAVVGGVILLGARRASVSFSGTIPMESPALQPSLKLSPKL